MKGKLPFFLPSVTPVSLLLSQCWRFHSMMSTGVKFMSCFFPLPAECQTHLSKKKREMGIKWCKSQTVKMMGESNLERYCISMTVWLQGGFIAGWASVLQSCFQAPVSYWRVMLCLPVLFTPSFLWQERYWHRHYSYLFHLLGWHTPSPVHSLQH